MSLFTTIDPVGWWQSLGDRRRAFRHATDQSAAIDLGNGASLRDCRIADISESGAKLTVSASSDLPDEFTLLVQRRCRVVRRRDGQVGVQFLNEDLTRRSARWIELVRRAGPGPGNVL